MGPGEGLSCSISLNTSLTPEQRALYQDPSTIRRILGSAKTIAVVGLSTDRQRASYFVAAYLQSEGYRIIPVNPKATEILGEKCYPDLLSIPEPVDIADIFRPASAIPEVVEQVIAKKIPVLWLQLRIINLPAVERARAAGVQVIMDKCVKMEHGRYHGSLHFAGMNTEIITARKARP